MTANGIRPRKRLKYFVDRKTQKAPVERGSHYVGLENVEPWTGLYLPTDAEIETESSQFRRGDVLFGKLRPYLAKVYVAQADGTCTSEMLVLRPREGVLNQFLFYRLVSADFIDLVNSTTFGSKMPRADWEQIGNISVAFPAAQEQVRIVSLLDRETDKVDALISKKQRLIDLFDEKRQTLISRAVTQGLDPNAPTKDSGVDWLGRIPAHWSELKLGFAAISMCDGPFGSDMKSSHYSGEGVRLIRLQNIGRGQFKDTDQAFILESHFRSLPGHDAVPGDLLIAGLGDDNHPVGRACILPGSVPVAMVKADCFRVRLRPGVRHDYASWFLNSSFARAEVESLVRGSTRTRINLSIVSQLKILVPPIEEQDSISRFLDDQTATVQTVVTKTETQIGKLREYRSALITAAVTGQLDLRQHEKKMEALA